MERIISIKVIDKVAYADKGAEIICNNSDYVAVFAFDDEWEGIDTKTARFTVNSKPIDVIFTGDRVKIPPVSRASFVDIGVFAGDMTTTPAYVRCIKSILCEGGAVPDPPPDVYKQIMDMLNNSEGGNANAPKLAMVNLLASGWIDAGEGVVFYQEIPVAGIEGSVKVDLQPTPEQLAELMSTEISMTTSTDEAKPGYVTFYAVGAAPEIDYAMQIMITEVDTE